MTKPLKVRQLFDDLADLPASEAWAVASGALNDHGPECASIHALEVGELVASLPTNPRLDRRPNLSAVGIDPETTIGQLGPDEREFLERVLREGKPKAKR